MIYIKYLRYVLRHRWFVMLECFRVGLYWRGLVHDLSKLRPSEFIPYARYFYGNIATGRDKSGYYKAGDSPDERFNYAWLLHQKRNDHHWQWWYLVMDQESDRCFPMCPDALIEMIADWKGAGKAITGKPDADEWYRRNKGKIRLSDATRVNLEYILFCKEFDRKYFV